MVATSAIFDDLPSRCERRSQTALASESADHRKGDNHEVYGHPRFIVIALIAGAAVMVIPA
jgi:hypothetical protein